MIEVIENDDIRLRRFDGPHGSEGRACSSGEIQAALLLDPLAEQEPLSRAVVADKDTGVTARLGHWPRSITLVRRRGGLASEGPRFGSSDFRVIQREHGHGELRRRGCPTTRGGSSISARRRRYRIAGKPPEGANPPQHSQNLRIRSSNRTRCSRTTPPNGTTGGSPDVGRGPIDRKGLWRYRTGQALGRGGISLQPHPGRAPFSFLRP
jgi:hypothetical protein